MDDPVKVSTLKEHEKFWAFIFLIIVILLLVAVSLLLTSHSTNPAADVVLSFKLRVLDGAVTGLLTIAGMAAQALFRASQSDKDTASALRTLADKAPPPTGEAREALDSPPVAAADQGGAPWTK